MRKERKLWLSQMVVFHLEISRWNRQMEEQSYIYIFLLHRYLINNKMGLRPQNLWRGCHGNMHTIPVRGRKEIFRVVRELSKIKINEISMSDYGCLKEHLPKTLGQTIYQSMVCCWFLVFFF